MRSFASFISKKKTTSAIQICFSLIYIFSCSHDEWKIKITIGGGGGGGGGVTFLVSSQNDNKRTISASNDRFVREGTGARFKTKTFLAEKSRQNRY